MKKILFWTAIAAFATTGCTEADSLDELSKNPISFDTSVGKSNRSLINNTVYPTDAIFGATAFFKPTSGAYDYTGAKYFDNLPISYVSTIWKNASDLYYWPPTGTGSLKFAAYSPYSSTGAYGYTYDATNGSQFATFSQNLSTPIPQIDLMYAESGDLTTGPAALAFKHTLTQLYFTIVTAQKGFTFYIKELSLTTLYNTGSFKTLPSPAWTTSGATDAVFTVYSDPTGYAVNASASTPYEFPNRLAVIPQSAAGVKIHLKFDLKIGTAVVEADQIKDLTLTGTWSPNQRIKYAITITRTGLTEIIYTPTVTDWAADTTTPVP